MDHEWRLSHADRESIKSILMSASLDSLTRIKQDAERGPILRVQLKIVQMLAKHSVPGADEVLEMCRAAGLKKRKSFAVIVRQTQRMVGEAPAAWMRRIWDECSKYDTNVPSVISVEQLEELSRPQSRRLTH